MQISFIRTYFCKKTLMKLSVTGDKKLFEEMAYSVKENVNWAYHETFIADEEADGYFLFLDQYPEGFQTDKPIFFADTTHTLVELGLPKHVQRISDFAGFVGREVWDVAGAGNDAANAVLHAIGKKAIYCNDEPGLVSARILAMIINEAYFALGNKVSTKEDINIAMQYGTNYPHGPFEWAEIIGINKVYTLLKRLEQKDGRYKPAPLLESMAQ